MTTTTAYEPGRTSSTVRRRAAAVVGATVAAALVYGVATAAGISFLLSGSGQTHTVNITDVVVMALGVSLFGWATRAGLERVTRRGGTIWNILAGVVLAVSFLPIAAFHPHLGTTISLVTLHLTVAAVLIPSFQRS